MTNDDSHHDSALEEGDLTANEGGGSDAADEEARENSDSGNQEEDATGDYPILPGNNDNIDARFSSFTGERSSLTSAANSRTIRTYSIDNAHFLIHLYEENKQLLTSHSISFFESKKSLDQAATETQDNLVSIVARELLNNGASCRGTQSSDNVEAACSTPPPIHFADSNLGPVFLNYLSSLNTSLTSTRKRKRKQTSRKDRAILAHKIHKMKRTALTYMLRQFGVPTDTYYQVQECLSTGLKALKQRELERATTMNFSEGEDSGSDVEMTAALHFTLYKHICEWLLQEGREGIFAYAFTVITWNLGFHCGITSRIQLQHISMSSNGTAMKIQLPPSAGTKPQICLLYSNPFNPLICPFFALSIYLMAHPGIVSESEHSYLFSSSTSGNDEGDRQPSSRTRHSKFLERTLAKHRQDVHNLCQGLRSDRIGANTIHQGSSAVLSSFAQGAEDGILGEDSDRVSSIYRIKDYPSMPSFEYKGRILAGLDPEEPDFQVWPPKFEIRTSVQHRSEDEAVVRPFWTGVFGVAEIPGLQSVLCSLSACILYHHRHNQNFVKKFATRYKLDFVQNNPLFYAGLDTRNVVKKLRLPLVGPSPEIVASPNAALPRVGQSSVKPAAVDDLQKKLDLISKRLDRHEKSQSQLSTALQNSLKNVANEIRKGVRDEIKQYKETERGLARANTSMQNLKNGITGRTKAGDGAAAAADGVVANPAIVPFMGPDLTALHHLVLTMMSQMEGRLNRFEERLISVVSSPSATADHQSTFDDDTDAGNPRKSAKSIIHHGMYYHKTESRGLSLVPDGWKYPREFPVRHLFSRWFLPDIQNQLCPLRMIKASDLAHLKGRDGRHTMNDAGVIMRIFEKRLRDLGLLKEGPTGEDIAVWWQQCNGVVMDKIMQCPTLSKAKKSRLNEKAFRQIKENYLEAVKYEASLKKGQQGRTS